MACAQIKFINVLLLLENRWIYVKSDKKMPIYGNLEIWRIKTPVFGGTLVGNITSLLLLCGTSYISLGKRAEGDHDQQIQRDNFSLIISPLFMFKREFMQKFC